MAETLTFSEKNKGWTASESTPWLSLNATSGTGNVTLTVTVTSHSSGSEDRSAVIVFSTGDINVEHAITQQSPDGF